MGLPEVKLGLLPGAGGTQRLPRLIGAEKALSFMLSGDPIPGPAAVDMGIADQLAEGDVVAAGLAFAADLTRGSPVRRIRDEEDVVRAARGNAEIFDAARKTLRVRCVNALHRK